MQPIPQTPAPQQPEPHARLDVATLQHYWSQTKGRAIMIGAAALIGVCIVCSACNGIINAGATAGRQPSVQSNATATPAPKPTNTPAPAWVVYRDMVKANSTLVGSDATAVQKACSANDLAGCRAALKTFDDAVLSFQADLNTYPAPACLKSADTHLRAGLNLYDRGAKKAMRGIDTLSAATVSSGTADIKAGTTEINKATDATNAAKC